MKHPILRKMIPAGMVMVLLTGCGEKKVDYEMETEQETKGVVGTLDEFREADNWDDSFTVTTSDGDVKIRINATIDVPEADAMSVVAAEELKIDVDYKKKFLKAYFKDSEIYYHDFEHLTKEELQTAVDSMDGTIVAVQSQIDDLENNVHHQDVERHKEMLNDWKEETEEQKKQYEKALETAKDTYTAAEDYDSCNEYAGYCGDLLCKALTAINNVAPWSSVLIVGCLAPLLVLTGMHLALIPLVMSMFATAGYDNMLFVAFIGMNFSQFGVALACMLKTKNKNLRTLASSCAITAFLAGVTEPTLYGICVRMKKPLIATWIACIVNAIFCAIFSVRVYSFGAPSFFTMPIFLNPDGTMSNFYFAIAAAAITIVVSFVSTWVLGFDDSIYGEEAA